MATAGADSVYYVPSPAGGDHQGAARLWEACRRNGVEQAVLVNPVSGRPDSIHRLEPETSHPAPSPVFPRPAAAGSRTGQLAPALASASLAVLLVAPLVPTSGTPITAR